MTATIARRLVATFVALLAFGVVTVTGTLAVFSDQETNAGNTFSTGSINLTVAPTSAIVSFSGMMPGDQVTDDVVVTNAGGSDDLRYAISSTATDPDTKALKDQLVLTVRAVDATTPGTPCDDFDGTQLYNGDLDASAGLIVGDAGTGADAGDRTLAAGAGETLCFRVLLPSSTGNTHASASTTATFTFDAEQTDNNP